MFVFANIKFLYLLGLIPIFVVLYLIVHIKQQRRLKEFGNIDTLGSLMPNVSKYRPHIKFGMLMLVLALLIVAMARPQVYKKQHKTQKRGIEAMLVIDISNSMLTRDIEPSRIDYAKLLLSQMIDKMTKDKIGLIVFAGDAFIQMPLTSDNVSAKMFLKSISPDLIQVQGTAIGSAIDLAVKSFDSNKKNVGRAIFVITDAENHEDNAVEAAKMAKSKGISVNVIGVGNPNGSPIPIRGTMSFFKDKDGNVVVSKLNEELGKQIAEAGNGIYLRATNSQSTIKTIEKEINKIQKGDIQVDSSDYEDKFYIPVWIALFLIVVEFFVLRRKNKRLSRINIFEKKI